MNLLREFCYRRVPFINSRGEKAGGIGRNRRQSVSAISRCFLVCLCMKMVRGLDLEIFSREKKERVNRGRKNTFKTRSCVYNECLLTYMESRLAASLAV